MRGRLVLTAAISVALAIVVSGAVLWFVLDRFVRAQVDGRLDAQIAALLSAVDTAPNGEPRLARPMDGPPFDRPDSGWYWEYRAGPTTLRSNSLGAGRITIDTARSRRDEGERPRPAEATGPNGGAIWGRFRSLGEAGPVVIATAPVEAIHGPLRQAIGTVALTLVAVAASLVAAILLQVRLGLRPLRRLEAALGDVRSGRRDRVQPDQPAELRSVVGELNALLAQNAENLDRARMHVANLAHGLKTPLATLAIALSEPGRDPDGRLGREVDAMDRRVRHHLRRARAAALAGSVRATTPLAPCLADLRAACMRLHATKDIAFAIADIRPDLAVACESEDLDEMMGNLIDNACAWCRGRVAVTAVPEGRMVVVTIEDDGPGLGAGGSEAALMPGRRLDETVPGSGFGLPITRELAELHGGRLELDRSPLGGVAARLVLPQSA